MFIRPQRGGFKESMAEAEIIAASKEAIIQYLRKHSTEFVRRELTPEDIVVSKYGDSLDPRNGWDTHLVSVEGMTVGFTDQKVNT